MKICYVGDAESIHTRRWAEFFAKKGHEVHLISLSEAKINGVTLHLLGLARDKTYECNPTYYKNNRFKFTIKKMIREKSALFALIVKLIDGYETIIHDLRCARRCREIVLKICPDIVHGHFLTRHGFYAACAGFRPLVLSAWGSDVLVFPKGSFIQRIYCKYSIRRADIITVESKTLENALLAMGAANDKIVRFSWGIDCGIFSQGNLQELKKLKGELRIAEKAPVVLSNRGLYSKYNIERIIRAIPIVRSLFPNVIFIVLGGVGCPEYINKIKEEIGKLDVLNNVRFISDFVSPENMAIFLNASDILVSIPNSESFSISVLEAMGCGVIPIMSNINANREIIEQGGGGFLLSEINEEKLGSTIVHCIKKLSHFKDKMQIRNRSFVMKYHTWEISTQKMDNVYQALMEK